MLFLAQSFQFLYSEYSRKNQQLQFVNKAWWNLKKLWKEESWQLLSDCSDILPYKRHCKVYLNTSWWFLTLDFWLSAIQCLKFSKFALLVLFSHVYRSMGALRFSCGRRCRMRVNLQNSKNWKLKVVNLRFIFPS